MVPAGRSARNHAPYMWSSAAAITMFAAAAAGWASISSVGWFQLASAALASTASGALVYREALGWSAQGAEPAVVRPESLPGTISDFTGREPEIERLVDLFSRGAEHNRQAVVISALAGKGGVGKTRLAVHVAHL